MTSEASLTVMGNVSLQSALDDVNGTGDDELSSTARTASQEHIPHTWGAVTGQQTQGTAVHPEDDGVHPSVRPQRVRQAAEIPTKLPRESLWK